MKIRPPVIACLYLLIALGLHYLLPRVTIIHTPYRFLGILMLAVGIFHKPPTVLVTTGILRFSRNPMYLGVSLVLLGIAVLVGTLPLFFVPVAFLLTMHIVFIPREEEIMERIFGQAYRDYKNRVRRWL